HRMTRHAAEINGYRRPGWSLPQRAGGTSMSKLDLGPIGIALNVSADDTYLKEAAELEELGLSAIWLPGGQIDSLDRIAAIAGATTSVPVASAVIPLD